MKLDKNLLLLALGSQVGSAEGADLPDCDQLPDDPIAFLKK